MCGIIAAQLADSATSVSPQLYEGLGILQHRGQDAAGIITCGPKGRLYQCKGNGMVRDVFEENQLMRLSGPMGVGHVRYPTAGTQSMSEAQPFYVNSPYGIVLAHNGNLTNAKELTHYLDYEAHRHINTDSDSELLLNVFADHLNQLGKVRVNEEDVFKAISGVFAQCRGGFACLGLIAGFGLVGFRDANGIRPLVYGRKMNSTGGMDYMLASESVALDVLGYRDIVDVRPGEAIIITRERVALKQCVVPDTYTPCIFEYVYFARPDSIMNGISVYKSRLAMGEALANQVARSFAGRDMDIDVVIPVPDTSRTAALQLATHLDITYREGFIKNRYVGRTFIMPGQLERKKNVRRKLNPMHMEFADKVVLIVDDSVVRGTTSKEIVTMAREAGAKKVYFASCAPPIRYPNVYGIDMPTASELVAHGKSEDEIAAVIGADMLIYQELSDLVHACCKFNPEITAFDVSVFNGQYVTKDVTAAYLQELQDARGECSTIMAGKIAAANGKPSQATATVIPASASVPAANNGDMSSKYGSDTGTIGLYNSYMRR